MSHFDVRWVLWTCVPLKILQNFTLFFSCPSSSMPTFDIYWPMVMDLEPSRPNQTKPTRPTYLTYFPGPPELPRSLTYPPTWPTHLTYPPICLAHLLDLPTHPDNLPEPTDNLPEPTDNLSQYRQHNFDKISQSRQNLKISTKISEFRPNFRILTKFQILGQISEFWPNFTNSTKFQNFDQFFIFLIKLFF